MNIYRPSDDLGYRLALLHLYLPYQMADAAGKARLDAMVTESWQRDQQKSRPSHGEAA